jgi:hypothetical protein
MQSMVIFRKIIINVLRKLKINLYLGTNHIFYKIFIIRNGGSIIVQIDLLYTSKLDKSPKER